MTTAAAHATAFYADVAKHRMVYALSDDGGFPVLRVGGSDVVPFWSSRSRVETVLQRHTKYAAFGIEEIPLADFLVRTLSLLADEAIRVGVNWSGPRLTGYDISVDDVRRNISHHVGNEG